MSEPIFLRFSYFLALRWLPRLQPSIPCSKQKREGIAETAALIHSINVSGDDTLPDTVVGTEYGCEHDRQRPARPWVRLRERRQTVSR